MARIRAIKPEFSFDEDLAKLPIETRLFYVLLWGHMDREGRGEDKPLVLRAKIYPYDPSINADTILSQLHPKFVLRYEIDGKKYLQVKNWEKHQRPHQTEVASIIPKPNNTLITQVKPLSNASATYGVGVGVGVGNGKGVDGPDSPPSASCGYVDKSVDNSNEPFVSAFCEYYDKGQGSCSAPKAEKSKYCSEHKLKVREKYLMKENKMIVPGKELKRMA